jgi:hypothetical protein
MQHYTTFIIEGKKLSRILDLPQQYDEDQFEVKIRALKKQFPKKKIRKKNKFDSFFGVLQIENIDEEIRSLRDEWETS